jgi:hypothetical protein
MGGKVEGENAPVDLAKRNAKASGKYKKVCTTDRDATMATSGRNRRLEPSYKQHTTVCDETGVIVDVEISTGEVNEGGHLVPAVERVEALCKDLWSAGAPGHGSYHPNKG